jgi:hypothetical protein
VTRKIKKVSRRKDKSRRETVRSFLGLRLSSPILYVCLVPPKNMFSSSTWRYHVAYIKVFNMLLLLLLCMDENGTIKSKAFERKLKAIKINSSNIVLCLLIPFSHFHFIQQQHRTEKNKEWDPNEPLLIYAKLKIIRLNTLHNFHPEIWDFFPFCFLLFYLDDIEFHKQVLSYRNNKWNSMLEILLIDKNKTNEKKKSCEVINSQFFDVLLSSFTIEGGEEKEIER